MATLRYRYRLYPTEVQKIALARTFGCVRVVWNDALARAQEPGMKYDGFAKASARLTAAKKTEERKWLNDVSCVPLQQALRNQDRAFQNFFKGCKGEGPRRGFPTWKRKDGEQSAEFTRNGFKIENHGLYLAKIGTVEVRWSRDLPSVPKTATVTLDTAGRYHVSFTVEKQDTPIVGGDPVGIDLGITTFAALSTGDKIDAPDYKKIEVRIGQAQRKLARCQRGSARRARAKHRVAKLHARIGDIRRDFLAKTTTQIVRSHSIVVIEDLNVSGMVKNHHLARAISRQGWRTFRILLEEKCARYGCELRVLDRWKPTSQICSNCGHRWGPLPLHVREIKCEACGVVHDRDINAARTIVAAGLAETQNGRGERVRHLASSEVSAVLDEASTAGSAPGISGS